MGRRGGGRGPGRHLAGPAAAVVAARHGRAGGHGGRRDRAGRRDRRRGGRARLQAAQRGAPAVLCRRHARPPDAGGDRRRRGGQRRAPVPLPGRAGRRRDRDRARIRVRPALAVAARADRGPAAGRGRPAAAARAPAGGGRPAGPAGAGRRPRRRSRPLVPAHHAVRSRPAGRPGLGPAHRSAAGQRADAGLAVAGGVVHPLRAALAAGGGCRRRIGGRGPPLRHRDPRGGGARRRGCHRRPDRGPYRRGLASPGLRQPLVQREAAGTGPPDGEQVPGLAPAEPAGSGRPRGERARPGRRGGDHRPGGPAGTRRRGPGDRGRPEDQLGPGARCRPGPAPAARGVPARGHAGRVRAVRPDRARRRGARPGRQGQPGRAGPGAAAGLIGRRPGAGVGAGAGRDRGRRHGGTAVPGPAEPRLPPLPGRVQLPGARVGGAGDAMTGQARYSPAQLAMLLGLPEPTGEQAAVIAAPPEPLAVIAGAGSGKSETMAARLVWLVANGMVAPERVLGLTFTRKAAAELGQRVRTRLAGLRRAGLAGSTGPASGPRQPPAGTSQRGAPQRGASPDGATLGSPLGGVSPGGVSPGGASLGGLSLDDLLPRDGLLRTDAGPAGPGGTAAEDTPEGEPVVSTYHAYAARLVADHALREALEPSLRLITPAVAWQIAARVVAAYSGPMDAVDRGPQWVTAAVLDLAGELAEHLRSPGDVQQVGRWLDVAGRALPGRVPAQVRRIIGCQRTREQLLPMVAAYTRAKAAREVIDYGDQVALAARIAGRHPQVGAIERARFQVVLLDEYQDTSHAQLVLLQALFGGGHPVTAVGDPCQSIYGWRGASAGNLRRFVADFPVVGQQVSGRRVNGPARRGPTRSAGVTQLSTSFRNTERVLDAAAALQEGLRAEAPQVPRLVPPPRRAGRGRVVCALLETAAGEAAWVAAQIEGLLDLPPGTAPDGGPWTEPGSAGLRAADVAVLCRKRSQFPALRAAVEARGIPVEVVGLGGLLTVPEVADVVATLRVLHDPAASSSLARLLTGPRWRIGPRDLVALGRRARDLTREHRAAGARPEPAAPEGAVPHGAGREGATPGAAGAGPATPAARPAGPEGGPAGAGGQPRGSVKHDD